MTDRNWNTHSSDVHRIETKGRKAGAIRCCALFAALALVVLAAAPAAFAADSVATDPAADVHHTDAVLRGHFELGGGTTITNCHFDWGTSVSYGSTLPCAQGNTFTEAEEVSAPLGFLTPGTTYHYRLHLSTAGAGELVGADRSVTPAAFPVGRRDIAQFGPDGTSSSTFPSLGPLAFDSASSKLYAFAPHSPTGIFGFDASGIPTLSPLAAFNPLATIPGGQTSALAVDESGSASNGRIYLASDNYAFSYPGGDDKVHAFDPGGSELGGPFPIDPTINPGGLTTNGLSDGVCGAAVDAAGDLWVAKANSEALLEYSSAGAFLRELHLAGPSPNLRSHELSPCRLAFDSNGDLYVASEGGTLIKLFAPTYSFAEAVEIGANLGSGQSAYYGVAVDPLTHNVFAAEPGGENIAEFDSAGSLIREIHEALPGPEFRGVADDPAHNLVYASDSASKQIQIFGAPETLTYPTVSTGSAGRLTDTSARLRGEVDPEGQGPVTACEFQFVRGDPEEPSRLPITGYRQFVTNVPCSSLPGSGSGDVAVSADIGGLEPNTTYHFRVYATNADGTSVGSDASFTTASSTPAVEALETLEAAAITDTSARLKGTLDPAGSAITDCHFDWGTSPSYGRTAPCSPGPGSASEDVAVRAAISGLQPNSIYYFRLEATNAAGTVFGAGQSFVTRGPPQVETTGSPIRTATTAELLGRVDPREVETTFHFEYGSQGPCDANPCASTSATSAGSGGTFEPVAARLESLQPGTTYHYRLIADNGNPAGPAVGEDRTLTTRASDAPLQHGEFAGPPASDRAWELVSAADANGNPVPFADDLASSGDSALYTLNGGAPISSDGSNGDQLLAERHESAPHEGGWENRDALPPRSTWIGNLFAPAYANEDLSKVVEDNRNLVSAEHRFLSLSFPSGSSNVLLPRIAFEEYEESLVVSEDASRVVIAAKGSLDPDHPHPAGKVDLYDISSGTPRLVSLLPGGSVPSCGAEGGSQHLGPEIVQGRGVRWLTPDGSRLYFPSQGNGPCSGLAQLYTRDLVAEQTERITPAPVSGPDCGAAFIRSTPEGAFFWTQSRLSPEDSAISGECSATTQGSGGDVYRYSLADHTVSCVTCTAPGQAAEVSSGFGESPTKFVGVAADGSRVYFVSDKSLILGAPTGGAIYRVDVADGNLGYVAPDPSGAGVGDQPTEEDALSSDGSVFIFASADPGLNAIGGAGNGGTTQFYRYDDTDRSLVCISCPGDGSAPLNSVPGGFVLNGVGGLERGTNLTPIDTSGDDIVFSTDTPLVPEDQNTAATGEPAGVGEDVYEWRDGRLMLITDGRSDNVAGARPVGITPSGRDVFFRAGGRLTPEAPDAYPRLYDARIGGGFTPPAEPPPPCDLNSGACEGPPSSVSGQPGAGSKVFEGPGNPTSASRCRKGKVRKGGRCVARHRKRKGKKQHHKKHKRNAHHREGGRR
jgi:hypothetical protein